MKRIFSRLPWVVSKVRLDEYIMSKNIMNLDIERTAIPFKNDIYEKIEEIAKFFKIAKSSALLLITIYMHLDRIRDLQITIDKQEKSIERLRKQIIKKDTAINELIKKFIYVDNKHKEDIKEKERLENFIKEYKSGLSRIFYKDKNK